MYSTLFVYLTCLSSFSSSGTPPDDAGVWHPSAWRLRMAVAGWPHQDAANSSSAGTRYLASVPCTFRFGGCVVAAVVVAAPPWRLCLSWRKCFALAYGICRKSIASSLSEWLVSYLSRLSLLLANKTLKSFLEVVYGHEFGRYVDSMKAGYARPVCPSSAVALGPRNLSHLSAVFRTHSCRRCC